MNNAPALTPALSPKERENGISATTRTAGAGVATVDAPVVAESGIRHTESTGPAQLQNAECGVRNAELNQEADMIRFIDSFWAHLNDMRRPEPKAEFYRLHPGTADCLRDQCRIEHARLVVLDAQRGAAWLGQSRKKIQV